MAVDGQLLRGEVSENPQAEEKNIELLLSGFLHALVAEQMDFLEKARPMALQAAPVHLALSGPETTQ